MNFEKILEYHQNIWEEVDSKEATDSLLRYYKNIYKNKKKRWFYAFNWAYRLSNLVKEIEKDSIMLDAACGLGTESVLVASLGAEVLGIDLNEDKINKAIPRKSFYERKLGQSLSIDLKNQNILDLNESNHFDVVWCMEAISHIYPTDEFFQTAYNVLKPGGKIIISDPNALNPIVQYQFIKACGINRGTTTRIDPNTGNEVEEWNERIRSPFKLAKEMEAKGFKVKEINFHVFFPRFFIFSKESALRIYKIEKIINRVPFVRGFGGIYTIIAEKV